MNMKKSLIAFSLLFSLLLLTPVSNGASLLKDKNSSDWISAWETHMFCWYYRSPNRTQDISKPWPTVFWLQDGPAASGAGIGNFEEIGLLDSFLEPRNSTWLQKADLLFVDDPVGTGYSYVEDPNL